VNSWQDRKIRAVIVDDEELARQVIRELLAPHPEIEVVGECANGFEAVKIVTETKPDLIFLDIQMPKLDGFEVLELIGTGNAIVFVTAYDSYAIRAFEVHAVDYLLKPFGAERFEAALERAKERLDNKLPSAAVPATELAATARPRNTSNAFPCAMVRRCSSSRCPSWTLPRRKTITLRSPPKARSI
jgi:two-component system LytT family response regulator